MSVACGGADTGADYSEPRGVGNATGSAVATSTRSGASTSQSDTRAPGTLASGGTAATTPGASTTLPKSGSLGGNVSAVSGGTGSTRNGLTASSQTNNPASSGKSGGTFGGNGNAPVTDPPVARPAGSGGAIQTRTSVAGGSNTVTSQAGKTAGGTRPIGTSEPVSGRATGGNLNRGGGVAAGGRATGGNASAGATTSGTYTLDCGPLGWAVEAHGPPENRVNYVILGDGYLEADLVAGGKFEQHINKAMKKRFSVPIGEVYSRYRNFVNICGIKLVSSAAICTGKSALQCCGDDNSRLAECSYSATNSALKANLPATFVVDWRAIVLNGNSWWNTGSELMLWSGGHADAAGAALHEGGHGFHWLADEYTEGGTNCTKEFPEVNSTADAKTTAGKWDLWLNYNQVGATGLQSTFEGSNYCAKNQYRPSDNSMMNMLFGENPNTSYNSVSREQMIFTIWRALVPIDSAQPPAGSVSNPTRLSVKVIDPAVINVDWSVDGVLAAANGGETFDVTAQSLSSGTHTVTAKAYDNAGDDLVRNKTNKCPTATTGTYCARTAWSRSQQTITWSVTLP